MLTKEAWNAFLKTLEEPPPNTVFVLATTESHKVMATIVDRCQRFDFQRPSLEQIARCSAASPPPRGSRSTTARSALIARAATGSFRDALGTLDQLVAFGGDRDRHRRRPRAARRRRRRAPLRRHRRDRRRGRRRGAAASSAAMLARSGRDPAQFARDLLAHLRQLLVDATIGEVPDHFRRRRRARGAPRRAGEALGEATLVARDRRARGGADARSARATTRGWPSSSRC